MRAIYDYATIKRLLNTRIKGRVNNLNQNSDTNLERDLINGAVREVISDIDFRGNIRESVLTPNLTDNQYDYALPVDVKADAIIDLRPQNTDSRGEFEIYSLVSPEEFDRRKKTEKGIFTITNDDLNRVLRINADVEDETLVIDEMEDTTWRAFPVNSVNDTDIKVDNDDYIQGNGAIRFQTDNTDSVDSTVGIQDTVAAFDLSPYKSRASAFVYGKLTTADTGIHQVSLRIGSDSDNYYQVSDSTQNDCTPFQTGWNLLRFDLANRTTVGAPVDTATDYVALFWSRDTTTDALLHRNDTDWGFDYLTLKKGKYYLLSYYTRYVWQDTALTLAENSTHDSYALLLQNDELELVMAKMAERASQFLKDKEDRDYYANQYKELKQKYLINNPSQVSILTVNRYNFNSLEDNPISFIKRDS